MPIPHHAERLQALVHLSRELGREDRNMAILGEGNTSTRLDSETFLVKASGSCLATLQEKDVVECRFSTLMALFEKTSLRDSDIEEALLASRVDPSARKPSVEALFHAHLLTLPGVEFVGHTHALEVNQILCSARAREFAEHRMFPDEVVCCGAVSVYVPYVDPGVPLAIAMRGRVEEFIRKRGTQPRVILLQNHGLVTIGKTAPSVLAAMLMEQKAAAIWLGAAALGGPQYLTSEDVDRIASRSDEHYRQRVLNL